MQLVGVEADRGDTFSKNGKRIALSEVEIFEQLDSDQGERPQEYWVDTWSTE
jgi:hypothetical protein